jgi:hypothetical protein
MYQQLRVRKDVASMIGGVREIEAESDRQIATAQRTVRKLQVGDAFAKYLRSHHAPPPKEEQCSRRPGSSSGVCAHHRVLYGHQVQVEELQQDVADNDVQLAAVQGKLARRVVSMDSWLI